MRTSKAGRAGLVIASAVAAGCAPALDWREFDAEGAGLHVAFPCRPERNVRPVALLGATTAPLTTLSCETAGQVFAVGFVDATDPASVGPVMREWRRMALTRLRVSGRSPSVSVLAVPGATPNAEAGALAIEGHLADGRGAEARLAWFAHGLRIYQAGMVAPRLDSDAAVVFFAALRVAG